MEQGKKHQAVHGDRIAREDVPGSGHTGDVFEGGGGTGKRVVSAGVEVYIGY